MLDRPRVAIVVSHPIQHFCPLYRAISADGHLDLKVFFGSSSGINEYYDRGFGRFVRWQDDLLEGFDFEFLPGAEKVTDVSQSVSNLALKQRLDAFEPDVVQVYGFYHKVSRDAIGWARCHQRAVLQVSDSELRSPRSLLLRIRKGLTVPIFLRSVDAFLTIGDCNEAYYRHYGASPSRFFRCPYPIDEDRLKAALQSRVQIRADLRRRLEIPEDAVVALTVGKLTTRKCADHAIRALDVLLSRPGFNERAIYLVLAGDGPEADALKRLACATRPERVKFAGFVEVTMLPQYYVSADLLIHPSSSDPHPLAVSEGVYCGLPAIVSSRVGSVGPTDDVRIGDNGYEYPFGNIEQLADVLGHLVTDSSLRSRMSWRSIEIGRERGIDRSVNAFVAAVPAVKCSAR